MGNPHRRAASPPPAAGKTAHPPPAHPPAKHANCRGTNRGSSTELEGWEGEAPAEPCPATASPTRVRDMECGGPTPLWLPAERADRSDEPPACRTSSPRGLSGGTSLEENRFPQTPSQDLWVGSAPGAFALVFHSSLDTRPSTLEPRAETGISRRGSRGGRRWQEKADGQSAGAVADTASVTATWRGRDGRAG